VTVCAPSDRTDGIKVELAVRIEILSRIKNFLHLDGASSILFRMPCLLTLDL
jgi:hypothetical protein